MTYTNLNHTRPAFLKITKPVSSVQFIVHGQGVLFFNATEPCSLTFSDASGVAGLHIQVTESAVHTTLLASHEPLVDPKNTKGLVSQPGAYYWVSLDSQNQRIIVGIGEARMETVIYSYEFSQESAREGMKLFLESLVSVQMEHAEATALLRDPITRTIPLIVAATEQLTMDSIASSSTLPSANLSLTSQKLHSCISGKHFTLDTPDFPDFAKAIEYSIATPGKWCHETLKRKATEFNKDKPNPQETYLRITLGENNGESPGIPYVMEIWPVGHYSPIHNHGGASAIIRVLHGTIHVSLFPFLSTADISPFATFDFKKENITWISPTLNQVHQLKNVDTNKDTCITIQCYMYETDNSLHYDYFDYIDAEHTIQSFEPDSDMDFIDFKKTMKREWIEAEANQPKRRWC